MGFPSAKQLARRYRLAWQEPLLRFGIPFSVLCIFLAGVANALSDTYATDVASNSVTDIVLSNIPVFDVDAVFVYGALGIVAFIALLCVLYPRRIPFTLYSLSTLCFIRALFVSLTHIGPYPEHVVVDVQNKIMIAFFGAGDQFFSNHTAIPFMMALVYWQHRTLRYFFLACSLIMSAVVLLGHLHYTIDVLSAFFITYTLYCIACYCFPREQALFNKS